jgi:hypothetical protein
MPSLPGPWFHEVLGAAAGAAIVLCVFLLPTSAALAASFAVCTGVVGVSAAADARARRRDAEAVQPTVI